ncbi:hypothetical protein LKL35_12550 [Streptomyces sp. ET3-23]|uniref:hypothetical protein n=1 Tax=Streptomyces sp. ET3-23 TaxID=2885643 RepID=UPI001D11CC1E|nr:hypothetical protein [Streptomyces sp. ET3-23]MCC2276236.1 hypothetical protein [Streptomyces sp. ET3-23]
MEPYEALDAVITDISDHRITGDDSGLFTAIRHIDLLCHLTALIAADTEYRLAPDRPGAPAWSSADALAQAASHIGRAVAHYTQALAPLVALAKPGAQDTIQKKFHAIDHHSRLRVHLDDAGQALAAARACLAGRPPPRFSAQARTAPCDRPGRADPLRRAPFAVHVPAHSTEDLPFPMTTPSVGALLFDVPAPLTPIERLLVLADHYTHHNDAIDTFRLSSSSGPDLGTYADSAQRLAHETLAAVKAVQDQQLYESRELIDAVVRLKQLAYLSNEAACHLTNAREALTAPPAAAGSTEGERPGVLEQVGRQVRLAGELTALAPQAAVESADRIAREMHRRRPSTGMAVQELNAVQHSALQEVARGHIRVSESLGRQYVHSRDVRVLISTLRSLEAKDLIAREPKSAPPAYTGGPLPDRVRLTSRGTAAVAAFIELSPAARAKATATARPAQPALNTASGRAR